MVSNFKIPELQVTSNIESNELVQVKSEFINQLNDLKLENKKYEEKIYELEENSSSYKNNIELLKIEKKNKKIIDFNIKRKKSRK